LVTALFVPLLLLCTAILWKLTGKISPMQIMTALLVTVFGGLTVWLNDPQFIKMKPTLIYLIFAGLLGFGLLRGQSYLRLVMQDALPMQAEGWMILTRRFTVVFFGLALLNEVIWRFFSEATWVYFKTFGLTAVLFGFFMSQAPLLAKYALEKDD
jgi:intracellular septation protein